jgi:hypothetical protein
MTAITIPDTVEAEVLIQACHTHRTWRAALPNGKKVIAFTPEGAPPLHLEPGAKVRARLSVADFSRAEILVGEG